MNNGFIILQRRLIEWEWYTDTPTKCLFLHLLLKANFKDEKWRGILIKKGQRLTSISHLAIETGLTIKQVRSSIEKLEKTGEVGKQTTSRNTIITIKNYDRYQSLGKQKDKQRANKGQTKGKQRATNNKDNKDNKDNNIEREKSKRFVPPSLDETISTFIEKGSTENEANIFWNFYDSKNWMVGKNKMKNWKSAIGGWISRNKPVNNNPQNYDY